MKNPILVGNLVEENNEVFVMEDNRGSLRIYEDSPLEPCVIGADVAEGVEQDQSAAIVLGVNSNNTIATYNSGVIDPDQYANFLSMLGFYYGKAFIGVECNSVGFSVVSDLLKTYPTKHIYFHYRLDEKTKIKTKKFGWRTDERTRHLMLGYLKQEIREGSTDLRDKILIQQCMKFVNEDGKPQAAQGEHDDLVFARSIAGMMRRYRPQFELFEEKKEIHAPKIY